MLSSLQLPTAARQCALPAALTVAAVAILGYHPYAEDGGIYLAALLQKIHPELYPHSHDFAAAHLGRSAYLYLLAAIARVVPVSWMLVCVYVGGILATLCAVQQIAAACFTTVAQRRGALVAVALTLSLPVAGTALYLADPYVTARSLSSPLILFAVSAVLRRRNAQALSLIAVAVVLHPLMALWGAVTVATIAAARRAAPVRATASVSAGMFVLLGLIAAFAPAEGGLARELAQSRTYWYLSRWEWYEIAGAVAPMLILCGLRASQIGQDNDRSRLLASLVACSVTSLAIALAFTHAGSAHLLVARMQPLRMLHIVYLLFFALGGGWLATVFQRVHAAWAVALALSVGVICFAAQRSLYSSSQHFETPGRAISNDWARGFAWVRANTSIDALVAMDARYISSPGEDAQSFRAMAQRSSLPDYSKDGGVASVATRLAADWKRGEQAQENLNTIPDEKRLQQLAHTGADWIILQQVSLTAFDCPYTNTSMKVCRLSSPPPPK